MAGCEVREGKGPVRAGSDIVPSYLRSDIRILVKGVLP